MKCSSHLSPNETAILTTLTLSTGLKCSNSVTVVDRYSLLCCWIYSEVIQHIITTLISKLRMWLSLERTLYRAMSSFGTPFIIQFFIRYFPFQCCFRSFRLKRTVLNYLRHFDKQIKLQAPYFQCTLKCIIFVI